MSLKITIETPEPNDKPNETFEIEIGSNQRLKILHQTILSQVKNLELSVTTTHIGKPKALEL